MPWPRRPLIVAVVLVTSVLLMACAQAPATTRTVVPVQTLEPGVGADGVQYAGAIRGTIEVWMDEYGIMTWMPHIESPGAYRFQVTNIGWLTHDFTLIHSEDVVAGVPTRSGRALLQGLPIVARSIPIESGATIAIDADLSRPGIYLALSAQGTDYGDGMVTRIRVGSDAGAALGGPGRQQPEPQPTPDLLDRRNIAVYVMDNAVMASRYEVSAGEVTLHVQNLGPSAHELALVQWRGDRDALPVDSQGAVMLETLTVLERLPLLPMAGEALVTVEVEQDFAYVLLSTSPGAYGAGVSLQLVAR